MRKTISYLILFLLIGSQLSGGSIYAGELESKSDFRQFSSMSRSMLNDDPNRNTAWEWYEYVEHGYTLYAASGASGNEIMTFRNKQLPFFSPESPAGVKLYHPNPQEADMYPDDGWVLLKRDFGTPESAPLMPFFFLYNKARGVLRYVFFNSRITSDFSYGLVKLSHLENGNVTSSFIFDDSENGCSDPGEYDSQRVLVSACKLMPNAWSFADFTISYDPNIRSIYDPVFVFEIVGVHESSIKLSGNLTLNQVFQKAQLNVNSAADIIGKGTEAYNTYSSVNNMIDELSEKAQQNPDAWYSSVVDGFMSTGISGYVGAIAGAARFIHSFIGGGKASQPIPLYFEGDIALSGTITEENPIVYNAIKVPGAPYSSQMNSSMITAYDEPLGVFSMNKKDKYNIQCDWFIPMIGAPGFPLLKIKNLPDIEIELNDIPGCRIVSTEVGISIIHLRRDGFKTTWISKDVYGDDAISMIPTKNLYNDYHCIDYKPEFISTVVKVVVEAGEYTDGEPITLLKKYDIPVSYTEGNCI